MSKKFLKVVLLSNLLMLYKKLKLGQLNVEITEQRVAKHK